MVDDVPPDSSPRSRPRPDSSSQSLSWSEPPSRPSGPEGSGDDDLLGAAASADCDALVELIAVFTHDLNNPLQTVLVLSELALDETMPGTEGRSRAEQCLTAADRLRVLAHAMAGLFRGRPLRAEALWERVRTLLGRRFERHGIAAELTPCDPPDTMLPALCERVVFTLALGAIGAAAATGRRQHVFELACAPASGRITLLARLFYLEAGGSRAPLAFCDAHLARVVALLRLDASAAHRFDFNTLRIELAADG